MRDTRQDDRMRTKPYPHITKRKANKAIQEIQADVTDSVGQLKWLPLDLSTIKGSRQSAEAFLKMENQLDILSEHAEL